MKTFFVFIFSFFSCLCYSQNAGTNAAPAIPEEARKHFVMGAALFKDAKTAEDYAQVTAEFKQATDLAPQWPEARYNLALTKEAAGDYAGAMDDLKLYQKFKLSDAEARTVQDKIYVLEAKGVKKQAAAVAEQEKTNYQEKIGFLAGDWNSTSFRHVYLHSKNERYAHTTGKDRISINGDTIKITTLNDDGTANYDRYALVGKIGGDDYSSIKWILRFKLEDQYPDLPIDVKIDKVNSHISWKEPGTGYKNGQTFWWPLSEKSSSGDTDLITEWDLTR